MFSEIERSVPQGVGGLLARATLLFALAAGLAIAANAVSPAGISLSAQEAISVRGEAGQAGLEVVELAEAQRIAKAGDYVILDARSTDHYEAGHIPGALSMPVKDPGARFAGLQVLLVPKQPVMVYCSGQACDQALRLGAFLREQGIEQVALFEGGMEVWEGAGLEVETGSW
jgi:rhodanese-related sulfurtransferase